mmetsp:Transcript_22640/g.35425  ORF Transcript_22640/g.35425 Transcript_22640/m.35425 type:complete len:94 (-) Transcript_22640:794-1075(-)
MDSKGHGIHGECPLTPAWETPAAPTRLVPAGLGFVVGIGLLGSESNASAALEEDYLMEVCPLTRHWKEICPCGLVIASDFRCCPSKAALATPQ